MMLETTSRRLFESQGRGALRLSGQGPGRPAAGARGRRPAVDPVHDRAAGRHRRDAGRARRDDPRAPRHVPRVRRGAGGDRPELPRQAGHRDAARRRPRPRRVPRRDRGHPAAARARRRACRRRRTWSTSTECRALLDAGVDDWGGVSPLTPDHVNPERPWPSLDRLRAITAECGFELRARLTVHPEYVRSGEPWLDPRISAARRGAGRRRTGWPGPASGRRACRGRSRTAASPAVGRTDLFEAVDTEGRSADRRVRLRRRLRRLGRARDAARPDVAAAPAPRLARGCPARPWPRPRRTRRNLTDEHALTLMTAEGDLLRAGASGWPTTCAGTSSATR